MEQHELNEIYRLAGEAEKLRAQNAVMIDVVRSAQHLVDVIHLQTENRHINADDLFLERYGNLRAALRSYYEPNGTGYRELDQ
jgi:hypothetical protein